MRGIDIYPFACAYCLTIVALVLPRGSIGIYYGAAVLVSIFVWRMRSYASMVQLVVVILCGVALAFGRMHFISSNMPDAFRDMFDSKQTLVGTVDRLPDIREANERVTIRIQSGIQHTEIIAVVPLYPGVHVGDRVQVSGVMRHPKPFTTDGGRTFAYDQFLEKDGVFGVMQPASAQVISRDPSLWLSMLRILEGTKALLVRALNQALPDPENSLAVGILVGGKQGLGQELLDDFGRAGMLQIVVLSGYNVMIVATALMKVIQKVPASVRFLAGSASIFAFILIAGSGSSAMRAGLMALFAIAAQVFGRTYDVLKAVILSGLMLVLWNPLLLVYDPGFQFSFIATIGLVLGAPIATSWVRFLRQDALIELVATTLAAEIALLPLLLWQTGNLSLVSIFANVIAMPAIPFAMAASAVAMAVSLPLRLIHPSLPLIAGLPAYVPLAYVIEVAKLSASLPFATITIPAFSFWFVLLSYGALAGLYLYGARRLRRENGAQQLPSSSSQGRHQHTSSSLPACSQP